MKELSKHHLSHPLQPTEVNAQQKSLQFFQQHNEPWLEDHRKECAVAYWGAGCYEGHTWFIKICSKTIRGLPFFFFHYSLDIVYLINNRDTLGAQIVDTVKNKGGGNMVKMKRGSKALCSRIGASKLKSCLWEETGRGDWEQKFATQKRITVVIKPSRNQRN